MGREQTHLDEKKPPRMTVRMGSAMRRELTLAAVDQGLSDNEFVVRAIERALDEHRKRQR